MIVRMSGKHFKMLCELFADMSKDIAKVDAPKEANAYNPSAVDIAYFKPKPCFRLMYNGDTAGMVIPDEVIV